MEPIVPLKVKTCRAGTSHPQPGCFSFAAASKPNLAVPEAQTVPRQSREASGVPLSPASSRPLGRKLLFGTPASCRRREGAKKFVPRPSPTTVPRSHHLPSQSRFVVASPVHRSAQPSNEIPPSYFGIQQFPSHHLSTDIMASMPAATIHPQSHVGFDSITSQIERKLLKRGFQFNVICVGK